MNAEQILTIFSIMAVAAALFMAGTTFELYRTRRAAFKEEERAHRAEREAYQALATHYNVHHVEIPTQEKVDAEWERLNKLIEAEDD